ncbi:FtsB family cell division protein [Akkermansia sp.]|uniref:FtsB family cell division protein n=1 Tax=Akkermansia sp. TaxID=1872421 RepID=UPI003A8A5555
MAELEIRREKRALIVQRALRLFAIVLALCLTMLLSLVCFKPWKDLRSLEHERSFLQARLEKAREQMEQSKNEFIWISQDPHYFEMIARDKGNLALPGEHILRFAEPNRLK